MNDVVIHAENLGKLYRIGERQRYKTLRDAIVNTFTYPFRKLKRKLKSEYGTSDYIWALRNISFEINKSEVVGIIGRNGAGKTTLLKILSRITSPTEGCAQVQGRMGSLLEVGTGFHPELTGRDNIYLNGAILGMKKAEIKRKFNEIVAFAEVEKFIDTPLKHYSSGMYVRLAFAVAAHLEPDILLVDEVLTVGDHLFQKRCLGKIGEVAKEGRTVLFVSHNMPAITSLCKRCLWINEGKILKDDMPQKVVLAYLDFGQHKRCDGIITQDMHINASGDVFFRRVALLDKEGKPVTSLFFGEPLRIVVEFEVCRFVEGMRLAVDIERFDGAVVSVFHHTDEPQARPIDARPGLYRANLNVTLPLMPGGYKINLGAKPVPGFWGVGASWDWVREAIEFYVKDFSEDGRVVLPTPAIVCPLAKWNITSLEK